MYAVYIWIGQHAAELFSFWLSAAENIIEGQRHGGLDHVGHFCKRSLGTKCTSDMAYMASRGLFKLLEDEESLLDTAVIRRKTLFCGFVKP